MPRRSRLSRSFALVLLATNACSGTTPLDEESPPTTAESPARYATHSERQPPRDETIDARAAQRTALQLRRDQLERLRLHRARVERNGGSAKELEELRERERLTLEAIAAERARAPREP